ncbi:phage tail tube protein [Caproiciproducens faecalis]|uniref:Uncharacterized protein n=1 Tax=Caproiciproducens faecalis TaxID=2820301 RepID=A0ABS7DTJ8_9FIRM|nr:hypothetical protein [Caproiciproducens faecalis]MBW7573916.1 hypothetical protein [Caproiciproducens faecalis]
MAGKIKRSLFAIFLNTAPSTETAAYALMGQGITSQKVDYGPETSDETYVSEDSGTTDVESYKPKISTQQTAIQGDAVFDYVDGLRQKRAVMGDARSDIVLVNLYGTEATGAYPAEKNAVSIQIDDFGGDGGKSVEINYTVNMVGDPVKGTFNPSTKTFTATGTGA